MTARRACCAGRGRRRPRRRSRAYRALGLDLVPGTGYLAACVPGSFDAWLTLLRDYGTWELADVLAFAIGYARDGFPMTPGIERAIRALEPSWTTSAALWRPSARLRNPLLADTYERLARSGGSTREGRIDAARDAWYRGWVAEAIVRRGRGARRRQLGRGARGRADGRRPGRVLGLWEAPAVVRLPRLDGVQDRPVGPGAGVPAAARAARRARPRAVPRRRARARRARVREARVRGPRGVLRRLGARCRWTRCSRARTPTSGARWWVTRPRGSCGPGSAGGCRPCARARAPPPGVGEPTRGDTCHLDVADRWGNLVSATPSGGWLQSSPALDGLGFCLGTRAQMFWLEDGLPASLVGGRRPRTTLSPSLGLREDGTVLAFGTPGGDQQDQWSLEFFLAHAVFGLDLQAAIDAPMFHSHALPELLLSARGRAAAGRGRGPRAGRDRGGAAGARA